MGSWGVGGPPPGDDSASFPWRRGKSSECACAVTPVDSTRCLVTGSGLEIGGWGEGGGGAERGGSWKQAKG